LKRPFYGSRKMAVELEVNRKRIQRLMRILGIEAHYPKPNLSRPAPGHQIYPYLLRGVEILRPTTSGVPILRTFRCGAAFSTL
jgi:putative transposase